MIPSFKCGQSVSVKIELPKKPQLKKKYSHENQRVEPEIFTSLKGKIIFQTNHFEVQTREPRKKKKTYYFPLYWLVNRDPYNGLL